MLDILDIIVDIAIAIGHGIAWLGRKVAQAIDWAWARIRERRK